MNVDLIVGAIWLVCVLAGIATLLRRNVRK